MTATALHPLHRAQMHLAQLKYLRSKRGADGPFILTTQPSVDELIADLDYLLGVLRAK